ncbi:MAG TPA: PKD domain-containing protein [Flavisolibacter sp.]|nr:PKD domain-containing protein [Flavisolibacter sp.]
MNCKSHILLLLSCLIGITSFSQNIEFIENKGQWDGRVKYMGQLSNGAFFVEQNGYTIVQHNGEDWEKVHKAMHFKVVDGKRLGDVDITVRSHAYSVSFIGSNPKAQVVADKPLYTYNNYILGNDPSKWYFNCDLYQAVTVKNIYPNVDVRYYSDNGSFKYDIIVHPGGDISKIAMKYDGAKNLKLKNKDLVIGTSVGELRELSPYTYQYNEKGKVEVNTKYYLTGNVVRFDIKSYDPSSTLIIDPNLIFCSFSGSTADNWGFTATYGPDGSLYGGGIVMGTGWPVSSGAFQTSFGGGGSSSGACFTGNIDIGIIKLSPDGTRRIYATYLGGDQQDIPQSLIVDPQGNLIVAGRTTSTNYPTKNGGLIGSGGGYDIVITKLNSTGTQLIGSRVIGGTGNDGANISPCGDMRDISLQLNYGDEARSEVNLDAAGNIYLAACTQSVADASGNGGFPVVGGFQSSNAGGANKQDAIVLKFNPDLSTLLFSTYLGGSENDAAYVIEVNPKDNNIYVAGGTESSNLPGSTAGTIGASNHGRVDGFVSIISNDGSAILKTTYIGTNAVDQIYGLKFDLLGFPYVMGQTTGNWPIINAAWSTPNGRQFIAKLRPDLSGYVYSTVFGKVNGGQGAPDISPVAFLVDRCENVYVSGWGGRVVQGVNYSTAGVAGLPVTPDAIKSSPDISPQSGLGSDFYFFVLKKDATKQLYGSFFGQNGGDIIDHVDGGTSRFDKNGVIYQAICASCGNTLPFPTTPGAWATKKPASANCNLAMVKIDFDLSGVRSGIQSWINGRPRDTAGCVPLTVEFRDTVRNAVSYEWNYGDGSPTVATTTPTTTHTFNAVGTYRVMLVAIDSTTCNLRDTSYLNIKVSDLKAQLDFNSVKLNPCDSFKYQFNNLSVAPAARPFTATSFTWDFGDNSPTVTTGMGSVFHNYSVAGTYNVKLIINDSAYCNYPDTLIKQLRIAALVKADFTTPPNGCAPYNAQFTNTSQAGAQFIWDFGDGSSVSNAVDPIHLYQNPGTYTVRLTAIDSATCNIIDSTNFTITVFGNPTADFTASPQPPLENAPISFTNLSSSDAVRFKWDFGDGDTLVTTSRANVSHEYNATGTYNVCLIAYNPANCPDTICKPVQALVNPAVDVPTAFTPGKFGPNSTVYVRGFGIAKMKFSIWARWGEKVFETSSKKLGWDGYYKGKLLPMDVYAYTLEVEFTDGTKTTKTGDITLIR